MKKSIKKYLSFLLALLLILNVAGCKEKTPEGPKYPDRDVDLPTELPDLGVSLIRFSWSVVISELLSQFIIDSQLVY